MLNYFKSCKVSGIISLAFSVCGIVALICNLHWLLFVSAAVTLVDSVIQVAWGAQNGFTTEIIKVSIGGILSLFGLNFFVCASAAFCIGTFAESLFGIILLIVSMMR